ncbi:MAG: efflux RND transporter periplasmic adaptor subunit [Gammaproteobacteria bacterium]|nr:efflux RND transporter periplasmic adaptor subunit [Gammaproteobacteria bacterium]
MRTRNLALLALLTLAAGLGAWRYLGPVGPRDPAPAAVAPEPPPSASPPAVGVRVARVAKERIDDEITAVGTLAANESVVIRPELAARIEAIRFIEGAKVRAGDELFVLNADEIRATLAQTEAQQLLDRQNFERVKEMRRKNLTSVQQYDEVLAKLKVSDASVERERVRLAKMVIRAPFDGIVGLRAVSIGDYVSVGQDLVNLEAVDPVKLDFKVPEKFAGAIVNGLTVTATVEAYPGRTFSGKIYAIDPRLDEATRTVRIRARLANDRLLLRPGMFTRIRLGLTGTREALFVPEQAIVQKSSSAYVFRVAADKAAMVEVTTGRHRQGNVEITSGLTAGDRIVTDGQTKLRDGAAVTVLEPRT